MRPVDTSLYKELSAPYCVAGVVHRAGLGSDGMFLSSLSLESDKVEPLDAIHGPPWDRRIAHTVEFSKTACALRAGTPLLRRAGPPDSRRFRAGPTSIARGASPGNEPGAREGPRRTGQRSVAGVRTYVPLAERGSPILGRAAESLESPLAELNDGAVEPLGRDVEPVAGELVAVDPHAAADKQPPRLGARDAERVGQ